MPAMLPTRRPAAARTRRPAAARTRRPAVEEFENRLLLTTGAFLQGTAFVDVNLDGRLGATEPRVPGATITLWDQSGTVSYGQTTTDANGNYVFSDANVYNHNLQPGLTYRLVETLPAASTLTPSSTQVLSQVDPASAVAGTNNAIQVGLVSPSEIYATYNPSAGVTFTSPFDRVNVQLTDSNGNVVSSKYVTLTQRSYTLTGDNIAPDPLTTPVPTFCVDLPQQAKSTGVVTTQVTGIDHGFSANDGRIAYLYNQYGTVLDQPADLPASIQSLPTKALISGMQVAIWSLEYGSNFTIVNYDSQDPNSGTTWTTAQDYNNLIAARDFFLLDSLGKNELGLFLAATVPSAQGVLAKGSFNFANTPKASPSIATQAAATFNSVVGTALLSDSATITGGANPTGTILFTLTAPDGYTATAQAVTVNGNGTYASPSVPATQVGTYTWHAAYSGDALNNGAVDDGTSESVTTVKASPAITTQASASGNGVVGSSALSDTATITGAYNGTGTITFTLTRPDGTTVQVGSVAVVSGTTTYASPSVPATQVGTYTWHAAYSGDALNNGAVDDGTSESVLIAMTGTGGDNPGPAVSTVAGGTVVVGSGARLTDTAILSGGYNLTGTITFYLFAPGVTPNAGYTNNVYADTVLVNGGGTYSTATGDNPGGYLPTAAGTYQWLAVYSGDANNIGARDDGQHETEAVEKASPTVATRAAETAGGVVGTSVLSDVATITGSYTGTGTVTFTLTRPDGMTVPVGSVPVSGDGTYASPSVPATQVGTYTWHAAYSGDALNNGAVDDGTSESVTTVKASPAITTTPGMTTTTGLGQVGPGLFATIGFWHNQNGQAVIQSFGTTSTGQTLGSWLATSFPNLFGAANLYTHSSLAGLSNTQVAQAYLNTWTPSGLQKNTYVQAFAVALGLYADTRSLGGQSLLTNGLADTYGFVVTDGGAGTFNVEGNGAAFGVPNGTSLPVTQILAAANTSFSPTTDLFYGGDQAKASALNYVLNGINSVGDIPGTASVLTTNGIVHLNDTATLTGGFNLTGTITFYLMAPGSTADTPLSSAVYTDTVQVNGVGTYGTATAGDHPGGYVPTVTGTYQWVAVYSGDGLNSTALSPFGSEPWTVGAANTTINTIIGGNVALDSGARLTDSAILSNGVNPTGTITFYLYAPGVTPGANYSGSVYSDVVTVNGNGTYSTAAGPTPGGYLPTVAGTYQWLAVYSGDAENSPAAEVFGDEPARVSAGISGFVFCDNDLNGVFGTSSPGDGGETGAVVTLKQGTTVIATQTTGAGGAYSFTGLAAGSYTVTLTSPSARHVAELSHGAVTVPTGYTVTLTTNSVNNNFAEVDLGSVGGSVFVDVNDDGNQGPGEAGIPNVTVTLTGTDYLGNAVSMTTTTNSAGQYSFTGLLPSSPAGYALKETQPAGYLDGTDAAGTVNGVTVGVVSSAGDSITQIVLPGCNNDAVNYTFGEHGIFHGLTATIGFWHNANGQALIKSFGNTSNGLSLANTLATNLPNLFGKNAPAFNASAMAGMNLTNRSNADVAAYFLSLFGASGQKAYAQVLATALAVFTTTNSLNTGVTSRALATKYGFTLSNTGTGAATYAVPSADWPAFGLTSSTATQTISQLLSRANTYSIKGVLDNGIASLITETNDVFNAINNQGDIGQGMAILSADASGNALFTGALGEVYAGTYLVSIDAGQGTQAGEEQDSIAAALDELNAELGKYGVTLAVLPDGVAGTPDVQIHFVDTTPIGGVAEGVLGVTLLNGQIDLVNGWNWYTGADASGVGADQFDFQTVVTHELGHAIGLGHSNDTASVMYPVLTPGQARRGLSAGDLTVLATEAGGGPEALMAAPARLAAGTLAVAAVPVLGLSTAPNLAPAGPAAAPATHAGAPAALTAAPAPVAVAVPRAAGLPRPAQAAGVGRAAGRPAVAIPDNLPADVLHATAGAAWVAPSLNDWAVPVFPTPADAIAPPDAGGPAVWPGAPAPAGADLGGGISACLPTLDGGATVKYGTLGAVLGAASLWWFSSARAARTPKRRPAVVADPRRGVDGSWGDRGGDSRRLS